MNKGNQQIITRAERVRQRRVQHSHVKVNRAKRKMHYATSRPLVNIRSSFGTPITQNTHNRVRRNYAIPLSFTGAEVITPPIPVVEPGWRLLSAFLILLFGAILYTFTTYPKFQSIIPKVHGLHRLEANDVLDAIDLTDKPIYVIDPQEVKEDLESAFPELTNISVEVSLPASVVITARERQPLIAWQFDNQTLWTDFEGVVIPNRGDAGQILTIEAKGELPLSPFNLSPTLDGEEDNERELKKKSDSAIKPEGQQIDPALQEAILKLRSRIPPGTTLAYNDRNGVNWKDPGGWIVYLGLSLKNLDSKLAVYQVIVEKLLQQDLHPSVISVEHLHAPYYHLEH